jgi:D-alanyl-D-alanine carboxypeptidase
VTVDGVASHFEADGSATVGWYEDETGKYYFDEDGTPHTGWLDWEQKRYYLQENGAVTTGWLTLEGERYYFYPTGRMAIGQVEIEGVTWFFTSSGKEVLLCNPWYAVPEDFQLNLVSIEGYQVDAEAHDPLHQMMEACRTDGIYCVINSSYRSVATQQAIWDRYIAQYMAMGYSQAAAEATTKTAVMIPGHSEHQTGLAIDIKGSQSLYNWLGEHCWDYGFIIRYPKDRIHITGIIYEPWHVRYVGTELSLELKEMGLCMEEYMALLTEQQSKITD